jgi:hypothetical protein
MELTRVLENVIDEQGRRDQLKAKRKQLFERFVNNPADTHLALEIKMIDDQVAECTQQMERKFIPSAAAAA